MFFFSLDHKKKAFIDGVFFVAAIEIIWRGCLSLGPLQIAMPYTTPLQSTTFKRCARTL
jgi:hypothetical protein